jgi:hypothetical protein
MTQSVAARDDIDDTVIITEEDPLPGGMKHF